MQGAYSILSAAGENPVKVYLRETDLQDSFKRPKRKQISRLELVCAFETPKGGNTENYYFLGYIEASNRVLAEGPIGSNHILHIDDLGEGISRVHRNHELALLKPFFDIMSRADPWIVGSGTVMPETQIFKMGDRDYDRPMRQELRNGYRQFQREHQEMGRRFWRRPLFSVLNLANQY